MRRRLGWWLVVAVLAADCTTSDANESTLSDQADVWFMQHIAGHLLQTTSILDLTQDPHYPPEAGPAGRHHQPAGTSPPGPAPPWPATRGPAFTTPNNSPATGKETDLQRPGRISKAKFDLAFVKVMTAGHRTGSKLAAAELRDGSLPEVRQLAQQLLANQQAQIVTMTAWARAWSKASATPPDGQTSRPSGSGRPAGTPRG